MSGMSGIVGEDEFRCLSGIINIRCQNIDRPELIGMYIPIVLSVIYLPFVLLRLWYQPQASLLFLSLEIVSGIAVSTGDLVLRLTPIRYPTYQQEDIALGLTSSLPILFLLLTATSIYLALLRPHLPNRLRSGLVTTGFAVLVLPLVPIGFICALLGSVLLLIYRLLPRAGLVLVGFKDTQDQWINTILTSVGAIAVTAYLFFITSLIHFLLFHSPSRQSFTSLHPRSIPIPSYLSLGLFLRGVEVILTLAPTSFVLLVIRQCLRFISQGLLSVSLGMAYPPKGSHWREIGTAQEAMGGQGGAAALGVRGRSIGGPVTGTFRKLSTEATREFHHKALGRSGAAMEHGQRPGDPVRPERVVFRMAKARPPILSFTSSLFSNSITALPTITSQFRQSTQSPLPTSGFHSTAPQTAPSAWTPNRPVQATRGKAKKNVGSIYDPSRVSVLPHEIAKWPLPLPPTPVQITDQRPTSRYLSPAPSSQGLGDWPMPPPRAHIGNIGQTGRDELKVEVNEVNAGVGIPNETEIDNVNSMVRVTKDSPSLWISTERISRSSDYGIATIKKRDLPISDTPISVFEGIQLFDSRLTASTSTSLSISPAGSSPLDRISPAGDTCPYLVRSNSTGPTRVISIKRKAVPIHNIPADLSAQSKLSPSSTSSNTATPRAPPRPPRRMVIHHPRQPTQSSVEIELITSYQSPSVSSPLSPLRYHSVSGGLTEDHVSHVHIDGSVPSPRTHVARSSASPRSDRLIRRETEPAIAIDPEVTTLTANTSSANTSPSDRHPHPGTNERNKDTSPNRNTNRKRSTSSFESSSGGSTGYTDRPTDLFFSTPLQSPTTVSSTVTSPRKSYIPLHRKSWLDTVSEDADVDSQIDSHDANAEGGVKEKHGDGEVRKVMASLYRVTKDAGVDVDPTRLGLRYSQSRHWRGNGQNRMSESEYSRYSRFSGFSQYSTETGLGSMEMISTRKGGTQVGDVGSRMARDDGREDQLARRKYRGGLI